MRSSIKMSSYTMEYERTGLRLTEIVLLMSHQLHLEPRHPLLEAYGNKLDAPRVAWSVSAFVRYLYRSTTRPEHPLVSDPAGRPRRLGSSEGHIAGVSIFP